MKHQFIISIIILMGLLSEIIAQPCYELVWSDEFNYSGLPDPYKWSYETGGGGWGNNELQYYTENIAENARVENGSLIIEARKEDFLSNSYTSARLISYHQNHTFKYGKIEARIKLPYGKGIWPAFWMLGSNIFEGTPWPACGEIDIMEMVGGGEGKDDVVHGTVHWADLMNNHAYYGGDIQLDDSIFADDFHVFSIEWDSANIKWYMDGEQFHIIDITPGHLSEFHKEFFIILNLAVGGNWPGSPDGTTIFPQQLLVDYVRVYQVNKTPGIIGDTMVVKAEKDLMYSVAYSEDFTYSWNVPTDAVITEGQGTNKILVDWGCDTGSISCEINARCSQYTIIHKIWIEELNIVGEVKVEDYSANLNYSVPSSRIATYDWQLPENVILNSISDTNIVNISWNNSNGEILLILNNFCGTDSASLSVSSISQLPYPNPEQPHLIPGTIQSVHYDVGGEGISYHDFENENLGTGSRQDEGVDTEPNDGGENIGWLESGEWLEYSINVETTDVYNMEIRTASPNGGGLFKILFNKEDRTGIISVPNTGAWNSFTSNNQYNIQLYSTDTIMKIEIINGQFNMGRLEFSSVLSNETEVMKQSKQIYIYPTVSSSNVFVQNIKKEYKYSINDMMGQVIKTGTIKPNNYISINEIKNGAYILIIKDNGKLVNTSKFLKVN